MGLGRRFRFDKPQPQVFQDRLDGLPVFNEADDPHDSPTLRAGEGIDLVYLLNQPGPVLPIFLRALIRFQVEDSTLRDAGDPVVFGFFSLSPGNVTVVAIVPDHLLAPVRDVGTHGGQPFQGIEDLFLSSIFRPVNNL